MISIIFSHSPFRNGKPTITFIKKDVFVINLGVKCSTLLSSLLAGIRRPVRSHNAIAKATRQCAPAYTIGRVRCLFEVANGLLLRPTFVLVLTKVLNFER